MTAIMAKDKKEPRAVDGDAVTTVKCKQRIAKLIRKLAALLEVNQEEVLDRYAARIEEDLAAEMARQQTELTPQRPGAK